MRKIFLSVEMKSSLLFLICAILLFAGNMSAYDYCNNDDCFGICRRQWGYRFYSGGFTHDVSGTCENVGKVKNFCRCFLKKDGKRVENLNAP